MVTSLQSDSNNTKQLLLFCCILVNSSPTNKFITFSKKIY